MILKELIEIVQEAATTEGSDLEVVTTGHYGEPFEHSKLDFHVGIIDTDNYLNPIKPRKMFIIDHY